MIILVIIDLEPFITLYFVFILIFSAITIIMEADPPSDGDFINLPRFVQIFMHTFMISIGSVSANTYGKWDSEKSSFSKDNDF